MSPFPQKCLRDVRRTPKEQQNERELTTYGRVPAEPTLGEQMGITMPADTKIISTEREGDHVEPNVLPGESLSTAGPGGDMRQRQAQEHELKGMKQRLENNDERASREALGYDEPISRLRSVYSLHFLTGDLAH